MKQPKKKPIPRNAKDEYNRGYNAGYNASVQAVINTCYAAVCLALNDLYGYGQNRCGDVLEAVDDHIMNTLTSKEVIAAVYERIGLRINFEETFDRIERVKKGI